jgi:hypothetical protein
MHLSIIYTQVSVRSLRLINQVNKPTLTERCLQAHALPKFTWYLAILVAATYAQSVPDADLREYGRILDTSSAAKANTENGH